MSALSHHQGRTRRRAWPEVPGMLVSVSKALDAWPVMRLRGVVLAGLVLAFATDLLASPHLTWSIVYTIPVSAAAWHLGWRHAVAASALATAGSIAAQRLTAAVAVSWFATAWNAAVTGVLLLVIAYALTLLRHSLQHEWELARTDWLTGLPNTRSFVESANHEIARTRRSGSPITVAYIDLDGFKAINDAMGHAAGDELLRQVARALRNGVRDVDTVARLGGDEFAILLPDTGAAEAETVLDRLHPAMTGVATAGNWPVRFSMGAVTVADPVDADDLIARADAAMYEAKRRGGNQALLLAATARPG